MLWFSDLGTAARAEMLIRLATVTTLTILGVTVGLFEMGVSHLENSPWAPPKASKNPPRDPPHYGGEPLKI